MTEYRDKGEIMKSNGVLSSRFAQMKVENKLRISVLALGIYTIVSSTW
jgi:hypothetical protein